MPDRYIKYVKPMPEHLGEGEWRIGVSIFHKGLRAIQHYKKEELYKMLGDANAANKQLSADIESMHQSSDDEFEKLSVQNEIVTTRNKRLSRRLILWRILTLLFLAGFVYLLYLQFT